MSERSEPITGSPLCHDLHPLPKRHVILDFRGGRLWFRVEPPAVFFTYTVYIHVNVVGVTLPRARRVVVAFYQKRTV